MDAWFLLAICLSVSSSWFGCDDNVVGGNYFYATEAECLADAPRKARFEGATNKIGLMCVRGVILTPAKGKAE